MTSGLGQVDTAAPALVLPLGVRAFEQAGDGWEALGHRLGGSFFQTPQWAAAWWEAVGRPPGVLAVWGDLAAPVAVAGLVRQRRRLVPRVALSVDVTANLGGGFGAADHAGWLCAPGHAAAVMGWACAEAGRSSLELHSFCDRDGVVLPSGAVRTAEHRCLRLALGTPQDRLMHDAAFARKVRAYRHRLRREGIAFAVVEPGAVTSRELDALFSLNEARHAAAGRATVLHAGSHRALHEAIVRTSTRRCGAFAIVATHDERCVGILYGFRWDRTVAYFNSGWEPALGQRSVGTVLVQTAIDWSRDEHAEQFDFLRGPEPYKYRFGAQDHIDASWLVPGGLGGGLLRGRNALRSLVRRRSRLGSAA
jgi:CelD/BcsL family acetyltransferase involved in cellulose biosynthesis